MKKSLFTTILSFLYLLSVLLAGAPVARAFFPSQKYLSAKAATLSSDSTSSTPPSAGDYACILSENTFFYSAPDERNGLFLLPVTYYVKLLDYGNEYCRVEYLYDDANAKKLVGYAKTDSLTFVDYLPARPYFYYVFDLRYRIDETLSNDSSFLNEITVSCAYYGDYKIGSKTYCYVLRGDSFGYVPKPDTLHIPQNTEYAEYLESLLPPSAPSSSSASAQSSPAQIAILVALCLLVPVLAALILKPPRRPPYETDP